MDHFVIERGVGWLRLIWRRVEHRYEELGREKQSEHEAVEAELPML